jgi:hypothetical protein
MERMTSRDEDCVLVNGHALGYATIGELVQMAERLAAYEDMDSKRLRPGDTVWLSKMFYTRPKKPVPVTVDAIRCASTGSAIPVTIFSLSRQKNTTSTLETTKMPDEYISRAKALEDFEACNAVYPYRCLKHKAERFSEKELERRFFSGEECKDFEQRGWPDGNNSGD